MKVAKKYQKGIPYLFDANGTQVEAIMPPQTALKLAEEGKVKGENIISGAYSFPKGCFTDAPEGKATTKKELVDTVKATLTNKELKDAVEKGKVSPEKPHFTKNTTTEK